MTLLPTILNPDETPTADAAVYTAYDPEGGTVTWTLEGADKDLFKLRPGPDPCPTVTYATSIGVTVICKTLAFKDEQDGYIKPDFEKPMDANKDNVYEVTVQASDDANMGTKAVTVKVTNRQEDGKVKVDPAQPRIGIPVTAALTDSDIVSYGPMWQWSNGMPTGDPATCTPPDDGTAVTWTDIRDEMLATYTPHADDLGYCLRAVARYNDGFHEGVASTEAPTTGIYPDTTPARDNRFDKEAEKVLSAVQYPSDNLPPEFPTETTKRFVPENAVAGNDVGEPVTADDPNGAHTVAGYSLSGADRNSFDIEAHTGQLITGMKFNHEKKEKYAVTLTATDTDGATDSIRVDIYVADVDEKAPIIRGDQATGAIPYDENSMDEVADFSASDPEDATPITWSLVTALETPVQMVGGVALVQADIDDFGDFKIDQSGVLEFRSPPSFEDRDGGQLEDAEENPGTGSNTYKVVVQATDGDRGATPEDTRSWFKVTVNVSDVEEQGEITLRPTAQTSTTLLQPQVGVEITAADLMDGDGGSGARGTPAIPTGGITYQWYRTTSRSAQGSAISGETSATYTPIHLQGGASDIGDYLRVVATYTDGRGGTKTATAVSLYPTIRAIVDNQTPSFVDGTVTSRGVRETNEKGVNIGFPVRATDPEGADDEKLTYWLSGGPDAAMFSIDAATGQLKTKDELDREVEDGDEHMVTVTVTDSSGLTANQDSITVTIEVLELDEKPAIGGASPIEHVEGTTVLDTNLSNNNLDAITNNVDPDETPTPNAAVYTAFDPEGGTVTWTLDGADKDLFKLRPGPDPCPTTPTPPDGVTAVCRTLAFKDDIKPDFEKPMDANKDNVYEVTVQASDDANMGTKAVTVKVTNRQEDGKVKVDPAQPRIGIPVTAALTDSDIVSYGPMWQWSNGMPTGDPATCTPPDDGTAVTWTDIRDEMLATYTPHADDLGYCLRAVARYNDGFHEGVASTEAPTTGIYPDTTPARDNRFDKEAEKVLSAVQYPSDNLPPEFPTETTKRFVPENAVAVNDVGEPVTADDPNGAHTVEGYSLSGADQGSFDIDAATGQLITGEKFNHEKKEMYTVTVTATDTDGATDSIRVDIYVADVDERAPVIRGGLRISSGPSSMGYAEGGTIVATYTADGPMADATMWTLEDYDKDLFTLDPTRGASTMLKFVSPPDYEMAMDADMDNRYMVTVKAYDGTDMAMRTVTVTVTNENEPGMVELSSMTPAAGVALTATLTDPDSPDGIPADQIIWQWFKSMDSTFMDGTELAITAGVTSTEAMSSYTPVEADDGYHLKVMATYTDGHSNGNEEKAMTAGMVTTVPDQMGTVRLSSMSPVVGVALTATLTDPDGSVTGDTWQWYKSMDETFMDGTEMEIGDATSAYTPMADDEGYYLMVKVMYTDGHGAGKEAMATTTGMVTTVPDQMGTVRLSSMSPVVGVALTATLTDPDGSITGDTWQWYKSMDETFMDGTEMETGDGTSAYTPMADDEGYHLMVKVMYTDGHGAGKEAMATTTGMVTTVQDQMGTVRLSSMSPVVGVALTATLTDPDGSITGDTWQWYKSMDETFMDGTEMETGDGTSAYTPMADDEGYHLMVKVMYTDGHGAGKEAMATTTNKVVADADALLVARYDTNGTSGIQKDEVIAAINDYLFGEGDDAISKADVIRLINLYLFPNG